MMEEGGRGREEEGVPPPVCEESAEPRIMLA